MNQNDRYAPLRPELTDQMREQIEKSEKPIREYERLAIKEAKRQFALLKNSDGKNVVLPDEEDICLRFPGVDPRGQYSVIDMRFKSRTQRLDAVLNLREQGIRLKMQEILSSEAVRGYWEEVRELAVQHRVLTRAEKLCHDPKAAASLHLRLRKLELAPAVEKLDLVYQGLEYLTGIREEMMPAEVESFYRKELGVTFTPDEQDAAKRLIQPEESRVVFSNFENVLLQALFSAPENWGLTLEEMEALLDEE